MGGIIPLNPVFRGLAQFRKFGVEEGRGSCAHGALAAPSRLSGVSSVWGAFQVTACSEEAAERPVCVRAVSVTQL